MKNEEVERDYRIEKSDGGLTSGGSRGPVEGGGDGLGHIVGVSVVHFCNVKRCLFVFLSLHAFFVFVFVSSCGCSEFQRGSEVFRERERGIQFLSRQVSTQVDSLLWVLWVYCVCVCVPRCRYSSVFSFFNISNLILYMF